MRPPRHRWLWLILCILALVALVVVEILRRDWRGLILGCTSLCLVFLFAWIIDKGRPDGSDTE
jgi:fatty-acid desaturase